MDSGHNGGMYGPWQPPQEIGCPLRTILLLPFAGGAHVVTQELCRPRREFQFLKGRILVGQVDRPVEIAGFCAFMRAIPCFGESDDKKRPNPEGKKVPAERPGKLKVESWNLK